MFARPLFFIALLTATNVCAAPLSFRTVNLEARADCIKEQNRDTSFCHELTAAYPRTGDKTLDAWALRRVQQAVGSKNLTPKGLQAFWAKSQDVRETNQDNAERDSPCRLNYIHTLELEGQTPHYAVFGEEDWTYACGGYGDGSHVFLVVKRGAVKPKALALKDILLPNGRAKLNRLQKEAVAKDLVKYHSDFKEFASAAKARAYLDQYGDKDFQGTDNWRFAKGGLLFLFHGSELGSRLLGAPEAYIPAVKLRGIVKPEILREAAQYQIAPSILKQDKDAK